MAFRHAWKLLLLLSLTVVPAGSAAANRVTLAADASRNCTGEFTVRTVSELGQPVANETSHTERMTETLSVRLVGGRYELRHGTTASDGTTLMVAHVRPDGTVIDATLSGTAPTLASEAAQLQRLAMIAARVLPERLLMGREFHPGDDLYPDAETREIAAGMVGALGLPEGFQFEGSGGMPLAGVTGDGASRVLTFAGPMTAQGSGSLTGQAMRFEFSGQATTAIDATTGLLRSTVMEGTMELNVGGASQMAMHMRMSLTCIITSGTA